MNRLLFRNESTDNNQLRAARKLLKRLKKTQPYATPPKQS
jgi:hypothetical protein